MLVAGAMLLAAPLFSQGQSSYQIPKPTKQKSSYDVDGKKNRLLTFSMNAAFNKDDAGKYKPNFDWHGTANVISPYTFVKVGYQLVGERWGDSYDINTPWYREHTEFATKYNKAYLAFIVGGKFGNDINYLLIGEQNKADVYPGNYDNDVLAANYSAGIIAQGAVSIGKYPNGQRSHFLGFKALTLEASVEYSPFVLYNKDFRSYIYQRVNGTTDQQITPKETPIFRGGIALAF